MNVACTRAMEEVLIYHPYQRGSVLLASRLFSEHYCTTLADIPEVNSTASDWEAYIRKIYRRKEENEVAYNASLSVFVKKLGRKKEDFPRYLIHVGLEKAPATTAKDEQLKSIAEKTENNQAKQEKSEEVNKNSPTSSEGLKASNANSRKKPNNHKDKGIKNTRNSPEQTEKLGKEEPKDNKSMPKKATSKGKARRHVDIETDDLEFAASAEAGALENEKEEGTFFRSKPLNAEQVKVAKKKDDAAIRAFEQENKETMREHQVRSLKILGFTKEILSDVYLATGYDNEDFFRILFTTHVESGNKTLMIDALEDSKKMSELMSFLDSNPKAYSAFTPEMLSKIWQIKKNKKEDSICPLHLMLQTLNGHALLEKLFAKNPNFAQEITNIDKLFVPPKVKKHPWRSYKCLDNGLFLLIRKEDENKNKINTASSAKILANLLKGPLYEKLFGNDVKPPLIDVDGTTLLHYCIRIGNLDAVRAIVNSPGFSLKLLEYKDYLLNCNTLQLCRHLINDIIPQNKNKLVREAEIATQREIFSLLEAKVLESQRLELFNNFTLEKITNTFFGEGCRDVSNLSSEVCEKACRNFASLLLLTKGVSKLSTNADTSFSPGLLTKVINDPEKRKVLIDFLVVIPNLLKAYALITQKWERFWCKMSLGLKEVFPFFLIYLGNRGKKLLKC